LFLHLREEEYPFLYLLFFLLLRCPVVTRACRVGNLAVKPVFLVVLAEVDVSHWPLA
jgi:hypothetical protein